MYTLKGSNVQLLINMTQKFQALSSKAQKKLCLQNNKTDLFTKYFIL